MPICNQDRVLCVHTYTHAWILRLYSMYTVLPLSITIYYLLCHWCNICLKRKSHCVFTSIAEWWWISLFFPPLCSSLTSLFQFWRPLCTIDTSQWFRWFHSDKIVLVLHQDSALPRNLLHPSTNGRYASVQCRLAALHLFEFLKTWSSVILLENHSFIRFLPSTDSPRYFCLVRVAQKHPCVVLHIGHIEGTPHSLQMATVRSLVISLKELSTVTAGERTLASRKRSVAAVKGKSCTTKIDKQLQRVMIRYVYVNVSGG